jgi:hypothetical protein
LPPPHVFSVVKTLFLLPITLTLTLSFTSGGDKDGDGGPGAGGGGGGAGTLKLTDIPPEYNGQYFYAANIGAIPLIANSTTAADVYATISNGSATLNVYDLNMSTGYVKYSGSDNLSLMLSICSTKSNLSPTKQAMNVPVKFTNGSATKSYNDFTWN